MQCGVASILMNIEPGPPENLRVTHSGEAPDEFMLQWDIPRNPNGVILGYKVIQFSQIMSISKTIETCDMKELICISVLPTDQIWKHK